MGLAGVNVADGLTIVGAGTGGIYGFASCFSGGFAFCIAS